MVDDGGVFVNFFEIYLFSLKVSVFWQCVYFTDLKFQSFSVFKYHWGFFFFVNFRRNNKYPKKKK